MISKHTYLSLLIMASFFIHSCANYNGLNGGGLIKKTELTEEKSNSSDKLTESFEDEIEIASVSSPVPNHHEIIGQKSTDSIVSDKVSDCSSNNQMKLPPRMNQLIEKCRETENKPVNKTKTEVLSIIAVSLQIFAVIAMVGLIIIVSTLSLSIEVIFGGLISMAVIFLVATVLSFVSKFRITKNSHLYKNRWLANLAMLLGFVFLSLLFLAIAITYMFLSANDH